MELKARAGTIFHNCEKSNDGNPRKGDKSAIQSKLLFKFYNDGFISTSNSEQEQTNGEKYVFYCSVSQIHINPEKTRKNPIIMTV